MINQGSNTQHRYAASRNEDINMKLASFEIGNGSTWGVIENEEAVDVGALLRDRYPDLKSTIAADGTVSPTKSD